MRPAVSTDSARPTLTGVLLHFQESSLTLVAADAWRLAKRSLCGVAGDLTVIVPAKALGEVVRLFREEADDVELRFSPAHNQVFIRCGATEVASRLLDGQYPNYEQIIPSAASTVVRAPRADLVRAVRMVGVLADSMTFRPVSIGVRDGSIELTSVAMEIGNAEATLEAEVEGEATQIALNSRFLLDALAAVAAEQVELRLSGPTSPAVIRGIDTDDCTCVVMAVRVTAPPQARSAA